MMLLGGMDEALLDPNQKHCSPKKRGKQKKKKGGGVGSLLVCNPGHGVKLLEQCICTARSTQVMAKLFGVRLCYPCPGDSIASAACELLVFFACSAAVAWGAST